jgi:hypothetical protein
MHDDLATLVNPILRTALRLRDAWAAGGGPTFDAGREQLLNAFRALHRAHPPVRGESPGAGPRDLLDGPAADGPPADLGVAYPLACLADELFTIGSPVAGRWTDRKFEVEFHGTNDRAWRFWQQAELAAGHPSAERFELFYLCAALGFRGEKRDDPDGFKRWMAAARDRLRPTWTADWTAPPAMDPPARVPLRHGSARLRRMVQVLAVALLVCVPLATWSALRLLTR